MGVLGPKFTNCIEESKNKAAKHIETISENTESTDVGNVIGRIYTSLETNLHIQILQTQNLPRYKIIFWDMCFSVTEKDSSSLPLGG